MEISKAKIKLIASLQQRKHRREEGLFTAEGTKCVLDLLPHFRARMLVATYAWLQEHKAELQYFTAEVYQATSSQLKQMSALSTPSEVLAVFEIPDWAVPAPEELKGNYTLLLDGIQDPGNLGTIIRCSDWFGVHRIVCSPQTADVFNPKTVQATMGALARVQVTYTDLPEWTGKIIAETHLPVIGTLLDGNTICDTSLPAEALIVMGNEGKGLTPRMRELLTLKLLIPSFPPDAEKVESLNVAMATAIVLYDLRRRQLSL